MYIWVVLATFLAMLYSFNLSVRGDERRLIVEPLAEAEISRFALHHRLGQEYVKYCSAPPANSPYALDYSNLTSYAPVGFEVKPYDATANEGYKTEIYCLKGNWSAQVGCNEPGAIWFLVTFGPIPTRWLNRNSDTPNNDFLNALQNIYGVDGTVGYAVKEQGNKLQLRKRGGDAWDLPSVLLTNANGGFAQICGCDTCRRCLVYFTIHSPKI